MPAMPSDREPSQSAGPHAPARAIGEHPAARGVAPVHAIPGDDGAPAPDGIGLCLSGGGYRAMLFHLGGIRRLNEARLLGRLARVSSVSGGSITAATLGLRWNELDFQDGVAGRLDELVTKPVRELSRHTIDVSSVVEGLMTFSSVGERVAHAYREHLYGDATLQALPADDEGPRFVICATNMESGVLFRFSRPYLADWRVGFIRDPDTALADAVAASSAFPPVLSPFTLDLRDARWQTEPCNQLTEPKYRGRVALSDGGVYDNLGLEAVWKRCQTVLVSDAGGHIANDPHPPADWPLQMLRVLDVIDNQVRDLRKRQAVASYQLGLREGTYWGIRSDVRDYQLADAIPAPVQQTRVLAGIPTRLKRLDDRDQERLINWGYAICDTALRKWVIEGAQPGRLPYPQAGFG
jgi:NTE family protein